MAEIFDNDNIARDRRVNPRFIFIADCLLAGTSGARYETRVTELSMGGCFVDLKEPLPVGAHVRVSITKDGRVFEAEGRAIYSLPPVGIGIVFVSVNSENQKIIQTWLRSLQR
jgi:hypothetical protein